MSEEEKNQNQNQNQSQSLWSILKGNVGVLTWTRFILFFPTQLQQPYFTLYIRALGGTPQEIGFVTSMASLTATLIVPIGGYLADYYGRVKLVASAFYFRSVAYLAYAVSGNWVPLAAGKFYQGLTEYNHAAQSAIIADSLRPGRRAVGFAMLNNFPNFVTIMAPTVGAFVITQFGLELGMRYLLFVCFVSMFFVGFARQKFLKETLKRERTGGEEGKRMCVFSIVKEAYRSSWEAIKWTPRNLAFFVLLEGLSLFTGSMVAPFWILYAQDVIGLTIPEWGLILFVEGLCTLLFSIPAGMIVDRVGNRKVIVVTLLLSLFPNLLFIYSRTFLETVLVLVSLTLIGAFTTPACGAWLADVIPRNLRARVTSAYGRGDIGVKGVGGEAGFGYVLMVPAMVGALIGGFLYGVNPMYPWFVHVSSLLVCFVLAMLFLKEPEKREI